MFCNLNIESCTDIFEMMEYITKICNVISYTVSSRRNI